MEFNENLSPGLFIKFNEALLKLNIEKEENILNKINKLLNAYKKSKDKSFINLTLFLVDQYFLKLTQTDLQEVDFLLLYRFDCCCP